MTTPDKDAEDEPESRIDEPVDELDDPESAGAIPSATLAAHAAAPRAPRLADRASTDREIWTLAWPAILSQVMASLVSLIDIAMVGRLGTGSLAAVGYSTQFFFLVQSVLLAIGAACVALMSRAIGAGDNAHARAALAASLGIATTLAAAATAVIALAPVPLLALLDAPSDVIELAVPYFRLTLGSSVLLAVSLTLESAFRAARDTRTPMLIAAAVTLAKLLLNLVLIFGGLGIPALGLLGAGLATLLSQVLAVGLFSFAAPRTGAADVVGLSRADFRAARSIFGDVVRISLPAIAERVILNLAIMTYFTVLGQYGAAAIAAYTVGVRLLSFSWIPGLGFSVAAATLVGQALGARDPAGASRAGWRAARLAVLVSSALGVVYAVARVPLARVFTNDPAVIEAMGPFMLMLALAQPFMGIHFTLGGALRGAGDTVNPLVAAALGNWGFRVPIAYVCAHVLELGVIGVWAALIFDHVARAGWIGVVYWRGRWQRRQGLGVRPERRARAAR